MTFTFNKGQWTDNILFKTPLNFGDVYYEKDNFTFILYNTPHSHQENELEHEKEPFNGHHFKINFLNATTSNIISIGEASTSYKNYFIGTDSNKWASYVYDYHAILYQDLYAGINMKVEGEGDNMKYEYYVAPNADPNQIQVQYLGVNDLKLEKGNLTYSTTVADVKELAPYVFQNINGEKVVVKANYTLNKKTAVVQFEFPEGYDENYELVIDPTLIFSRLTESGANVFGFTATYDDIGRAYGGGLVFNNAGTYPTTIGAYDETYNGGFIDIGISCYHQTTGALIYSSYVGGSNSEIPNSMIVNNAGELVVLGTTSSLNFPVDSFAFNTSFSGGVPVNYQFNGVNFENGSDIVVFKLSNDGAALNSSTYLGGSNNDGLNDDTIPSLFPDYFDNKDLFFNYGDVFRGEVIIDDNDNVYIVSSTNSNDYPTAGPITNLLGTQDIILTKLNSNLDNLLFSKYLGGSDDDGGYSMKIDGLGNLIVVGGTKSSDFPTTASSFNSNFQGGNADGFICKLDSANGNIIASTFIGTNDFDQLFLIDLDFDNNIYVVGQTLATYPMFNATAGQANTKQFIVKLDNNLDTMLLSTSFGSSQTVVDISPTALLVDVCGNIYVSGWGGQTNQFRNPTNSSSDISGLPITLDAYQSGTSGAGDFYFIVFDKDVSNIVYGSYFGGTGAEHVDGGTSRFDRNGVIYQAVCASCSNGTFEVSPGFSSTSNPSAVCNLGLIKMDVYIPTTIVAVDAFPIATGCKPLTVDFSSNVQNVNVFHWSFGTGDTSILQNPNYTFTDTGLYDIVLIGSDSTNCNGTDTAYLQVFVGDDTLQANFADDIISDCNNLSISTSAPNYTTTQHTWDMGDGTFYYTESINHTYANPGSYTIRLLVTDSTSCELRDSSQTTVYFPPSFDLDISATDTFGCVPLTIEFNSSYSNYDSLIWDFGNGVTNNDTTDFSITYTDAGTFQVSLIIIDSSTCNFSDTAISIIVIRDDSVFADITLDSLFYECDSMLFSATSNNLNATSYFWDFDNGDTVITQNAQTTYIEGDYNGIYMVTDTTKICRPRDSIPFSMNILPRLIVDFTANDEGCIPLTIPFTNLSNILTADYFWDFDDDSTSTLFEPTYTYTDVGIYTVELYAIDTNTCNFSDTTNFVIQAINDSVSSGITLDSLFYECDSLLFSGTSNNATATNYFWDFGNGTTANTLDAQATYTEGNYQGFYVITDNTIVCNPIDTISFEIDLLPRLIVDFDANNLGCIPFAAPFSNLSNITSANYFWDFDDDSTSTLFEPTFTYTDVGTYTVELYATDTNTCNFSDTANLVIQTSNDSVSSGIILDSLFYECDSLLFSGISNNTTASSYFWDFGNGITANTANAQTTYTEGNYNGFYIITDTSIVCNPIDTISFEIDLLPRLIVDFDANNLSCIPFTVPFTNLSNIPSADYFWDFDDDSTSTLFEPTFTYTNVGTYTVELYATDTNTCNFSDTAYYTIEAINDVAYADIEVIPILYGCDSLVVQLNSFYPTGTHEWNMGNGDIIFGQSTSYTYNQLGTYTIEYTITDGTQICDSIDTDSFFVDFHRIDADFSASDSAGCIPLEVDFDNLTLGADTYWWKTGLNSTGNTEVLPSLIYSTVGSFPFTLVAYDSTSCNLQDTAIINIITRDDFVSASFTSEVLNACDSLLTIATLNTSTNATDYLWNYDNNTSILENIDTLSSNNIGTYTITLITENQNLCHPLDTFSQSFELLPNATVDFRVSPSCEGDFISIENLSNLDASFSWDFGNSTFSSEFEPEQSYPTEGSYVISLTIIDTATCDASQEITQIIDIYSYPTADFATDSNYYLYPDEVAFYNQSFGYDRYVWNFGDNKFDSIEFNPVHIYESLYAFTPCLSVWNEVCLDTLCKDIYIDFIPLIGVPNAFSPNGDGQNDIVYVEGLGIQFLVFKIYNRWGEVVFETNDQNQGWDGVFNGTPQEMEVYTYTVNAVFIDASEQVIRGNITLLR